MKLRFLVILIGTICSSGLAQTTAIDSLEDLLAQRPSDSLRVQLLNELSFKHLAYQPPLAKQYAEEALTLAQSIKDVAGEALALNRLSEYHWRQSNYARSVELATQSLKLAISRNDSVAMASSYRLLGIINTYGFKQYNRALTYEQNALAIYERKKDYRNMASLYGNITWIYGYTGQKLDEARRMAARGVRIADSLHIDQLLSFNYNSLGLIAFQQNQFDSALYFLDKSIEIGQRANDRAVVAYNKSIKGNVYLKKNDIARAQSVFHEAENESLALNLREVLKDSYNGLAVTYGQTQNFARAFDYQRKFTALKDSLVNWEITQKALAMQFELDEQKREARIAELQQQAERAKREKDIYLALLAVGTTSLGIIMSLVIRNNRQRRKNNELLQEKNKEIAQQNQQLIQANSIKDKLFSIVGHDLRSPLQSLKGMLGLVVRNEVSGQEFNVFAPKLHQQVLGLNETLENLLQWSNLQMDGWKQQPVAVELQSLANRVITLFQESASQKGIELSVSLPSDLRVLADSHQTELIFRNLVHNAIKFTGSGGRVSITATQNNSMIEIAFSDTGVGISAEQLDHLWQEPHIRTTRGTDGERGTGLGLTLCREMATNNGGSLTATSEEGKGSLFVLRLKNVD